MENSLLHNVYNPDVLSCIANLSNDEVFTPPELANKIIDMLPQELFENPDTTFLDPCCKSGVFLREIAKRLIKGLENQIPDLEKRLEHIFSRQLYGIAITELTSLLSRRSVYCSKFPSSPWSAYQFSEDKPQGNIIYQRIKHTWKDGKCIYCGASQSEYDRGSELETHAYQFIHNLDVKKVFNMKFDVIIGNPPYQLSDGGGAGDAAKPIYNMFIEQAIKLSPKYLSMIVPSRWMKGGRGLDSFRERMMNDTRMKKIFDFEDAKECFSGLHIDGGVCYFLWEKDYQGKVEYNFHSLDGSKSLTNRYLKTSYSNTVIRDARQLTILEKVAMANKVKFSSIVSSQKPYGIRADFFNSPERYNISTFNDYRVDYLRIFGVKGIKGGARRVSAYIKPSTINQGLDSVGVYKLFFSKAYMTTSTVPPEIIVANPLDICTETFLVIGGYSHKEEALNCLSYIKTKFFRALLFFNRHSLNISRDSFELIPLQDFTSTSDIKWNSSIEEMDKQLYVKYGLDETEINFIESMIKPME